MVSPKTSGRITSECCRPWSVPGLRTKWLRCLFKESKRTLAARLPQSLLTTAFYRRVTLDDLPRPLPNLCSPWSFPADSCMASAIWFSWFLRGLLCVVVVCSCRLCPVALPTPPSHSQVQCTGHVQSGPFQRHLAVFSLVISVFSSTIPRSVLSSFFLFHSVSNRARPQQ